MLEKLVQKFLLSQVNQKVAESYSVPNSILTFQVQSATFQISYMTLLSHGNSTGHGIYPAVYYYRKQRKIFIVYGQSKKLPMTTWDKFLNSKPKLLQIRQHFSEQEVVDLERIPYNYLENFAKAVFEVPESGIENADIEGIASALEEVIFEYAAISVLQLPQGFQMAGVQPNTPISNEPPENIDLTKKISTVAFVADNAHLKSLIAQFISSTSDKENKTRYASQTPSINFEIEMLPCPRGIAYLTMLAHGNETGFGIYPAIYIYLEQRKLFVVYGQSKATPPITWERQFSTRKRQPRQIRDYFKVPEIESIQLLQPRFNFLDNYASVEFDLKKSDTDDKVVANIATELQEVIKLYGEYYTLLAQENFEDGKVHQTLAEGVKVRSKSEVIIANMLHERKIPFEYEKLLSAPGGSSFLPDFTVNIHGSVWYWEHLGMLENTDYRDHWEEKQAWYEKHFSGQLITTEESAQLSVDANSIICKLSANCEHFSKKGQSL